MSLSDDEQKKLNHDVRNHLSNMVMTVSELKHLNNPQDDYQIFLFQTLENSCRDIERLLVKYA